MNSKFRVWDTGGEMHHPPHQFYVSSEGVVCWHSLSSIKHDSVGVYTPLFYTGLDDAEGTPVYQEDILNDNTPFGVHGVVRWTPNRGIWSVQTRYGWEELYAWINAEATVVGNIHEDKDLVLD